MDREIFEKRTGLTGVDMTVLESVPLFSRLGADALMRLLGDSSVRHYPRGTMLFMQGDEADRFFVSFRGWTKLFRQTRNGTESVLHVIGPRESFAEAAIFDSHDFPVSAEVVDDARLLVVPAVSFIAGLRDDADTSLAMMASLSRHNRFLVRTIEQMAVKSSTERLAMFLAGLCQGPAVGFGDGADHHCNNECAACELHLPLDKGLIAGRLNMQPETLSRSFAKLRDIGIRTKGTRVLVEDIKKLRAFSDGKQD